MPYLLALLLLLHCVCEAEEDAYKKSTPYGYHAMTHYLATEQTGHKNFNLRFIFLNSGSIDKEKNHYYSFDRLYFRVMQDKNTWQFNIAPIMMGFWSCLYMFEDGGPERPPRSLFDPGLGWPAAVFTMPLMLMNPTIGLLTETWDIGVGYNTDFILSSC